MQTRPQGTICHGSRCHQTGTCTLSSGIDFICVGRQLSVKCIKKTSPYDSLQLIYMIKMGESRVGVNLLIVNVDARYNQLDSTIITGTQNAFANES